MSDTTQPAGEKTARGYKGPKWLLRLLPGYQSDPLEDRSEDDSE